MYAVPTINLNCIKSSGFSQNAKLHITTGYGEIVFRGAEAHEGPAMRGIHGALVYKGGLEAQPPAGFRSITLGQGRNPL